MKKKEEKELYTCPICREDMEWKDLLAHKVIDCSRTPKEETESTYGRPILVRTVVSGGSSSYTMPYGKIYNPHPNNIVVLILEEKPLTPAPIYSSMSTLHGIVPPYISTKIPKPSKLIPTPYKSKLKKKPF